MVYNMLISNVEIPLLFIDSETIKTDIQYLIRNFQEQLLRYTDRVDITIGLYM